MKYRYCFAILMVLSLSGGVRAQTFVGDNLGVHNLAQGGPSSGVAGASANVCGYCHAPHGGQAGLWNQTLTTTNYTHYTKTSSSTEKNDTVQPPLGKGSNRCLSCHDGTIAVGSSTAYGQMATGSLHAADILSSDMRFSHPFSLASVPPVDNIDIAQALQTGKTLDSTHSVRLIHGNVECTSCHDPHVQARDLYSQNFLVMNSVNGALCLACHDPTRQSVAGVNSFNPLGGWNLSANAHAKSSAQITSSSISVGPYPTVGANACSACHAEHNANSSARLLHNVDQGDCSACHFGANVSPAPPNVFAEYSKAYIHPFPPSPSTTPTPPNVHDAAEAVLLPTTNRHATCADCHNVHASQFSSLTAPPALRTAQFNVQGVDISGNILSPVNNQYENCLRCHGQNAPGTAPTGFGYEPLRAVVAGNPYNVIPEFTLSGASSHPVMHARNSALTQASLRANPLNFNGAPNTNRNLGVGTSIFCTDCHNSDDNSESGLTGANGPHGSTYNHILERNYVLSQIGVGAARGSTIVNPVTSGFTDTSVSAPFSMCAKCHDLNAVYTSTSSWPQHAYHVQTVGASCSVCHTAHGVGANNSDIPGTSLINFDAGVVAGPSAGVDITYNSGTNVCGLTCHNAVHDPTTGTVSSAMTPRTIKRPIVKR